MESLLALGNLRDAWVLHLALETVPLARMNLVWAEVRTGEGLGCCDGLEYMRAWSLRYVHRSLSLLRVRAGERLYNADVGGNIGYLRAGNATQVRGRSGLLASSMLFFFFFFFFFFCFGFFCLIELAIANVSSVDLPNTACHTESECRNLKQLVDTLGRAGAGVATVALALTDLWRLAFDNEVRD